MADLVLSCEDPDSIRLEKNRTFFEWRYQNPLSRYYFLYAGSDQLEGYLVLQERLLKRQHGMRIVDWEATDAATFDRLLSAAITEIDSKRLTIWSATLPSEIQATLLGAGFEPMDDTGGSRRYRPGPLVAAIGDDASRETWRLGDHALTDLANWRLRMVCSDSS